MLVSSRTPEVNKRGVTTWRSCFYLLQSYISTAHILKSYHFSQSIYHNARMVSITSMHVFIDKMLSIEGYGLITESLLFIVITLFLKNHKYPAANK